MTGPWEKYQTPATPQAAAPAAEGPWSKYGPPEIPPPSDGWQDTPYGFKVKPIQIGQVQTVQRPDGAAYFGPQQGNTGKPGWFNAQGQRVGDAPGQSIGLNDWAANQLQAEHAKVSALPIAGQIVPAPISGMAKGMTDLVTKPVRYLAHATGLGIPAADALDEGIQQQYEKNWQQSKLGEMVGQTLPLMALGGVGGAPPPSATAETLTAAQRVKAALAALGGGIAVGGASGAALTPHPAGQSNEEFLKQSWENTKSGMGWGGGIGSIPLAIEALGPLWSGVRRLIVGKYGPAAQEIMGDLSAQGVEARPSTVIGAAKVATPSEEVASAKVASQNLIQDLAQNVENTPYRGLDRIQKAAQNGDAEAINLLERIGQPNQSPSQIAQNSGAIQAKRAQLIKNDLWQQVDALAGEKGVPLPQTYDAIQNLRAQMEQKGNIPGLSSELDRLERYFPQRDPETGQMVAALNPDKNFGSLKLDAIQRMNDILATRPDSADAHALQRAAGQLKNALEGDMHNFAANSGNDALWNAYNRANTFHREVYAPTQQAQPFNIQNLFATDKANNPTFADQLIAKIGQKSSGPERGAAVANALGQKGRAAFAQALVENSIGKGIVDRTGTWVPGGAASDLAGRMDTINALLPKGPERMQVQGVLNMLQHLAKASPENASALGERFAQVAGAGEGITGQVVKAYNFLKNGGIDLLFNSPEGKKFLFQMSEAKPGSKMAESTMQKIIAFGSASAPKGYTPINTASILPAAASKPTSSDTEVAQMEQK